MIRTRFYSLVVAHSGLLLQIQNSVLQLSGPKYRAILWFRPTSTRSSRNYSLISEYRMQNGYSVGYYASISGVEDEAP